MSAGEFGARGWAEPEPRLFAGTGIPAYLFEQVHVQRILIQVPEFLAGKSSESIYFYELILWTHFHFLNEMHKEKQIPGISS